MKLMLLFVNLTFGADVATTSYGLKHNASEALIPSQNIYILDGIAASEGLSVSLALIKLNKNHPKASKVLGWSLIAARGFIVAHNVNELRK